MSGFETDFITGRAIGSDDHAVAIVIAPKNYGYPNPKDFPAQPPIYPDTLFEAISMPLQGVLDEDGFSSLIKTSWG
jgi:hypothetical protein